MNSSKIQKSKIQIPAENEPFRRSPRAKPRIKIPHGTSLRRGWLVGRQREKRATLGLEQLESRIALAGEGLTAQYFHNLDFSGLALERTEAVNHNWSNGAPAPGIDRDSFSVRWLGQIEPRYSETYTFSTFSDDGVRLWIDGQLIIDNWPDAARTAEGQITLQAGQRYDIRLEYFEDNGLAQVAFRWRSASQAEEAIPASQLYSLYELPQGLRGEYSDDFGGQATRIDPTVNFVWSGRPVDGTAVDRFQVRWAGMIRADFSEEYLFRTSSDEGVRLWIGGELVIDNWTPHTRTIDTASKVLEAGKWYDVRLEHYDESGSAEMRLAWSSASETGEGVFEVIGSDYLRAAKYTPVMVANPLGNGADPFVVQHNGSYLLVRSAGGAIRIDRADRLEDIHSSNVASDTTTAWTAPPGTAYSHNVWAPELHHINGKWYIYFAADDGENENHRMYVLERDHPDPFGAYTFKGQITDATNRWAIDGTVIQWENQLYFVWSGWQGTSNVDQRLYIAPMSNPWTISGQRVEISRPTATWERHGLPINEGPQILINDGRLHIIFSGSGFWTHQYALGRLTYGGEGSLLVAANWVKASGPVFQRAGDVVGVGHASFTRSEDGAEHWIVYHAHTSPTEPARQVRIQPFTYNADGTPNFGSPLPNSVRLEAPSGEADANRPLLRGDFDANGVVNSTDLSVWRAQYATEIFPSRPIDGADFLKWQQSLGSTAVAAASGTAVAASSATMAPASAELVSNPPPSKGGARGGITIAAGSSGITHPLALTSEASRRRREHAIDAALSRLPSRLEQHMWTSLSEARIRGLAEAAPHGPVDDYRIGASGARLISIAAGKSLGKALPGPLGKSLAIEPAVP